jgi:hypothetical protein
LTTGELFCDSHDGSKSALTYSTIDLADGKSRGRCTFACNPEAQARHHAEAPARKKATAEYLREYMNNRDTPAKSKARQKTTFGKMTTLHRKLYNGKRRAKKFLSKTIKNIEDGEHKSRMMPATKI